MLVLKIIGILLGALVLLLALLALLNIHLTLRVAQNRDFEFTVRVLGIPFRFHAKDKKAGKEKKKPQKPGFFARLRQRLGLPDKKTVHQTQKSVKAKGGAASVQKIADLIVPILAAAKTVLRGLKLEKLLASYISGGDAAEAAMSYGVACAVLYPLGELVRLNFSPQNDRVALAVSCDYNRDAAYFDLDFEVSIRVYVLLLAAFRFLKEYLKEKQAD